MRHRSKLQAYVNVAKDILGLHNWEIEVSPDPVEDPTNDYAHIDPNDYADIAVVRFGPKFFESSAEKKRRIIAHELAHLHAYRATNYVVTLKKRVSPDLWSDFFEEYEQKEDIMIENMAKLFVRLLPRLSLPTKRSKRTERKK